MSGKVCGKCSRAVDLKVDPRLVMRMTLLEEEERERERYIYIYIYIECVCESRQGMRKVFFLFATHFSANGLPQSDEYRSITYLI